MRRLVVASCLGLLAATAVACSSSSGKQGVVCSSKADCKLEESCIVNADGNKYCETTACTADGTIPCPGDQVCDTAANKCVAASTELPPQGDGVTPDVIEPGDTPATETDTGVQPQGGDCKPCQNDGDCGGMTCSPVGAGKFCLKACTANSDCKGGYICYPVSSKGKQCLPLSYSCPDCAYTSPCGPGQACDLVAGTCKAVVGECKPCTYDFECGDGSRCYKKAQAPTGVCTKECPNGGECDAAKFTCGPNADGVKICTPNTDADCQACPNGQVLLSDGVTCAECQNSLSCTGGKVCDTTSHTCVDKTCTGGTKLCSDNQCHQCCADTDCATAPNKCTAGFTCEGQQTPCAAAGVDCTQNTYYPACCIISGTPQCCQCATSADCASIDATCTCDTNTNSCVAGDGSGAVCGGTQGACNSTSTCTTDADCPPSGSGATLACAPKGFCYDPTGACDGTASCCATGDCIDLMSLLLGGLMGGGGLPGGLPTGGGGGYCPCGSAADCLGGAPCSDMSILCSLPLIGTMVCPSGTLPSTMPQKMCVDPTQLLSGLLGGI